MSVINTITPNNTTYAPLSKRKGGRNRHAHNHEQPSHKLPFILKRHIQPYDLLRDEELDKIEKQSAWLLSTIGIEFINDPYSIELFKQAGAYVDGTRVRFEPAMIYELCAFAPSQFTLYARDRNYNIDIGGNNVVFAPNYGSPFVSDIDHGRRYATLQDFQNFVKLAHSQPFMHHAGGTICEPVDVPVNKRHLDMVYNLLKYSSKCFMGSVTAPERAQDSVDMAAIVFGKEFMRHHAVIQGNININSPLAFDGVMTGALNIYAKAGQALLLSPFILGGAMAPVTQPAIIAQAHSEILVAIALSQLIRKGTPVIYGNFLTTINLKTGAPSFGMPESSLASMVMGQLARRMGLPSRSGGHLTASKVADAQAMQESSDGMITAIMGGANFILQSAGWLEGGLTISYEKFMMDCEHLAMMAHFIQGLTIDDNQLGEGAYNNATPAGNFFSTPHTMRNFRNANYMSSLHDTNSYEAWLEGGSHDHVTRANIAYKKMLADYQLPYFDATIEEELQRFVITKKQSMPDQWY